MYFWLKKNLSFSFGYAATQLWLRGFGSLFSTQAPYTLESWWDPYETLVSILGMRPQEPRDSTCLGSTFSKETGGDLPFLSFRAEPWYLMDPWCC